MTGIYERIAGTIFGDPDLADTEAFDRSSEPALQMAVIADRVDSVTATWALGRLVAGLLHRSGFPSRMLRDFDLVVLTVADLRTQDDIRDNLAALFDYPIEEVDWAKLEAEFQAMRSDDQAHEGLKRVKAASDECARVAIEVMKEAIARSRKRKN
jgi:hypothetical protein